MIINLNGSNDSLKVLKLCILYFEDIIIQLPKYYYYVSKKDNDFLKQIYYLKEYYNVEIRYSKYDVFEIEGENAKAPSELANFSWNIVFDNLDSIFDNCIIIDDEKGFQEYAISRYTRIRNNEFKEIVNNTYKDVFNDYNKYGCKIIPDDYNIYTAMYCEALIKCSLCNILSDMLENKEIVNDSQFITDLLIKYYKGREVASVLKNNIHTNCLSIMLPNLSNATFDDIYEMKYKMKDEFTELRYYISTLTNNINITEYDSSYQQICMKINSSIKNLEHKIKTLKLTVAQKFVTEIKNPLSYAPLLGSLFINMPEHISLLASIGLIGANTGLEYIKQLEEIKNDNMYFLFKLRNML